VALVATVDGELMTYFSYAHFRFRYEPYPIGLARPLMDGAAYRELLDNYPDHSLFQFIAKQGNKFSLSEKNNPREYEKFVRSNAVWRDFRKWIKSESFIVGIAEALRAQGIDLGYAGAWPLRRRLRKMARSLMRGRLDAGPPNLSARFEFSMLPADGGTVVPHTDAPGKVVTIVVSMVADGEWDPAWGGGTDVNRFKDAQRGFNWANRQASFDEVEVIDTFDFLPNQAVLFIKTFNSWHSVRTMTEPGSKAMRRTLTINIEAEH
jgi:hypothetical protein